MDSMIFDICVVASLVIFFVTQLVAQIYMRRIILDLEHEKAEITAKYYALKDRYSVTRY